MDGEVANNISIPIRDLASNELRLNGRILTSTISTDIEYKLKKNGTNIDLLLETGNGIDYNNITIELSDGSDVIVTDCVGNLSGNTPEELKIGKTKLIQIPFINFDSKTLALYIRTDITYTVNLIIDSSPVYSTYGMIARQNNSNLNGTGDNGYPKSYSNLPILLTAEDDIIINFICSDSEGIIELPDDISLNVCYDLNILDMINKDNILNPPEITDDEGNIILDTVDRNNLIFNLANVLDLDNNIKSDYYLPIVVEFKKEGKIISSRSLLLTRAYLKLIDNWGRDLTKIDIDKNDTSNGTYIYTYDVLTPRYSTVLTPYIKHLMKTDNDVRNLTLNMIRYRFNSNNDNATLSFNKGVTNYLLELTMPIDDSVEFEIESTVNGIFTIDNKSITVNKKEITDETIITLDLKETTLEKEKEHNIEFNVTNAASIDIINMTNDGIQFDIEYLSSYIVSLPYNNKDVYPEVYGYLNVTPSIDVEDGDYTFKLVAKDCNDNVLKEQDFSLTVRRPIAESGIIVQDKYYVDIDRQGVIGVKGANIYQVELDLNSIDGYTAAIANIVHSEDVDITGTYVEYDFDILLQSDKTSNKTLVIICKDQDLLEIGRFSINIEFYTSKYNSNVINPKSNDFRRGLVVKTSYSEKMNYSTPAAFVNNGEELAGILVAKYPIPQESFLVEKNNLLYTDLSKLNYHRVTHIPQNLLGLNNGEEGGELVKFADPSWSNELLENVVNNDTLLDKTYPVLNSAYLDTVLSYIKDSNIYSIYSKNHKLYGIPFTSDRTDEYSYGVSSGWYSTFNIGKEWKIRLSNQSLISEKYEELNTLVDNRDDFEIPLITNNIYNSHNGTLSGIMDIGIGIKVYTDVRITSNDNKLELQCINPYINKLEYTENEDKFINIIFKDGKFLSNIEYGYIGPNDYTEGRKHYTFSGELYKNDEQAYLMDNIGLPMNNLVYDYATNNAFPGMSGVSTVRTNRYSGSTYCMDLTKIQNNSIGYLVNGGWYTEVNDTEFDYNGFSINNPEYTDYKVIKYDENIDHSDNNHITNLYREVINKQSIGIQSRWLVDHNAVYNINKNANRVNDQVLYNNRIHFLIYDIDKINRFKPSKFNIKNKFIALKAGELVEIEFEADIAPEVITPPNDKIVKLENTIITGLIPGETKVRYLVRNTPDHNPNYQIVYIKVLPYNYEIFPDPNELFLFYGSPNNYDILISVDYIDRYDAMIVDKDKLLCSLTQIDHPEQNTPIEGKGKIFNTLLLAHYNQMPDGEVGNNIYRGDTTKIELTGYNADDIVTNTSIPITLGSFILYNNPDLISKDITIYHNLYPSMIYYVDLFNNLRNMKIEKQLPPGYDVEYVDVTDWYWYYLHKYKDRNDNCLIIRLNDYSDIYTQTDIITNAHGIKIESNLPTGYIADCGDITDILHLYLHRKGDPTEISTYLSLNDTSDIYIQLDIETNVSDVTVSSNLPTGCVLDYEDVTDILHFYLNKKDGIENKEYLIFNENSDIYVELYLETNTAELKLEDNTPDTYEKTLTLVN